MTYWQLVFSSSKVNGCDYREPDWYLKWDWPKETWFQQRKEKVVNEAIEEAREWRQANEQGSVLFEISWMFLVAIFAYWLGSFIARHPNVPDFIWHALVGR